jgi:SAM-dependent methyltransferase
MLVSMSSIHLTLKGKLKSLRHHPSIIKDILQGHSGEEIRKKVRKLEESLQQRQEEEEVRNFIIHLKQNTSYHIDPNNNPKLNKLCCIEHWQNNELKEIISELQHANLDDYIYRKGWEIEKPEVNRKGFIHRKDWEWALGVVAMKRFDKLNKNNRAIGVGCATEEVLFYLANRLGHVYATDLYDGKSWKNLVPADFPENPKKYAPFPYDEDALTVMRMDATKLQFPDDSFDIAFSFSSIEHFGGNNHSGALKSLREMERVLKPGGIAVVATEYIVNDKENIEFFNKRTIYSDLINKLEKLQLVEPLDLRITTDTLDTVMDHSKAVQWNPSGDEFKKTHPLIVIKIGDILLTSVMLVFQKQYYKATSK